MRHPFNYQPHMLIRKGKFSLKCLLLGHYWKVFPFGKEQSEAMCMRCGELLRTVKEVPR